MTTDDEEIQLRWDEPESQDATAIVAAVRDLKATVDRIAFWVTLMSVVTLATMVIGVAIVADGGGSSGVGIDR